MVIAVNAGIGSGLTAFPTQLAFDANNWNTAQQVTLTVAADASGTATVQHLNLSTGDEPALLTPDLTVRILAATVTLTTASMTTVTKRALEREVLHLELANATWAARTRCGRATSASALRA